MNPYKYLIWEYSRANERWFDATDSVEWIKDARNSYFVKFKSMSKPVHVSYFCMRPYANPEKINYLVIEHKGIPLYKTKECLLFDDKYKIFYENGYVLVADKKDIKIYKDELEANPAAKGILNYYKRVVQLTANSEEDAFMLTQFDNITNVRSDSVLALYLKGENGPSVCGLNRPIISPFGTNLSQLKAVKTAFNNRISIIEGPPGTGKTQTILNLVANAVANNYKIAVVSNNNSAIENVYEKLKKNGFGFLCALLGNKENTDAFFEHIDPTVPELTTNETVNAEDIKKYSVFLPYLFDMENQKNRLIEEKESIEFERKHFLGEHSSFNFNKKVFKTADLDKKKVLAALISLREHKKEKLSLLRKIELKGLLRCYWKFFRLPLDEQVLLLQNQYFVVRIEEIEDKIRRISKNLNDQSFEDVLKKYQAMSLVSFKNSLSELFKNRRKESFEKNNYKMAYDEFVDDYPVILSSTYSLAQCTKNGYLFDYLIVDESSQVNMASAILSMRVAKNIVIVGDIKQLPQIDEPSFAKLNESLLKQYGVDKAYSYHGHSIMSSVLAVYKDGVPRTLLKEHYRCNPEIIGFCNQEFYNNELVIYSKNNNQNEKPLRLIKLVPGNHARKNPTGEGGLYSEREADEVIKLIDQENPDDLGVITPYRIQAKIINDRLGEGVAEVSTIHKFQGREKKNIVFSAVVNEPNDFVDDPNIINVAVSRAIDCFTLIASDKVANGDSGVLADLVNYIKYHSEFADIQEGTVNSVFDILYSDYSDELEVYRKRHPSKDFDSENLVRGLLLEVLGDKKFHHLKMSMHVSLKDIFRGKYIPMTRQEFKFFQNPRTHADFVIYNRFSNKPCAIIEVDGVSFHEQNHKQLERDTLKDSIIKKSGIKILRLKTNESNEKERIINLLS